MEKGFDMNANVLLQCASGGYTARTGYGLIRETHGPITWYPLVWHKKQNP